MIRPVLITGSLDFILHLAIENWLNGCIGMLVIGPHSSSSRT
jgi:hypothetical protein